MTAALRSLHHWFDENILELLRGLKLSYLPPLMVYMAAGISGLTAIVGTFFVKDHLGLSAEFLAALGFWVGIPYAVKMPIGHVVDLIWRWKGLLVYLGASLIAAGLLIMLGLISHRDAMAAVMPVETWFVLSELLAPIGFVTQDVVADAMTVEAVPKFDDQGASIAEAQQKLMHTTMQTLGRVAIIGGGVLVAVAPGHHGDRLGIAHRVFRQQPGRWILTGYPDLDSDVFGQRFTIHRRGMPPLAAYKRRMADGLNSRPPGNFATLSRCAR